MSTLDRSKIKDARLIEAVRRGMLDPKVAARQVDNPLTAKKLRGRARHLQRTARPTPQPPAPVPNGPPSERFLRTIAFTRAKPTPPIACRCGNGHPDGSICSVPE